MQHIWNSYVPVMTHEAVQGLQIRYALLQVQLLLQYDTDSKINNLAKLRTCVSRVHFGQWPHGSISSKFGHHMAPLALVLSTKWGHFQIWPPDGATCISRIAEFVLKKWTILKGPVQQKHQMLLQAVAIPYRQKCCSSIQEWNKKQATTALISPIKEAQKENLSEVNFEFTEEFFKSWVL